MTCSSVSFNMLQPNHGVLEMQGKIHGKSVKKKHGISQQSPRNRGHGAEAARPKMPGSYNDVVARLRSWFSGSGFQLPLEEKPWKTHGKTHGISWVKSMDSLRLGCRYVWLFGTDEELLKMFWFPKTMPTESWDSRKAISDDNVEGIVRYRWFIFKHWSATPLLCKDVIFGPRASV